MTQVRIQKESEVRLRIVGTRNDANEIVRGPSAFCSVCDACALILYPLFCACQFCVGTIKDNYLGLIGEAQ